MLYIIYMIYGAR